MDARPGAGPSAIVHDGWRLRVLGPLELRAGATVVPLGGPQQRLVLALLAASSPQPWTTDQLITTLWPDDPPDQARKTVQVYVSRLRRQLGGADGPLGSVANGYRLTTDKVDVDAATFEELVSATATVSDMTPQKAADQYRRALGLWVGPAYGDVGDAEPIRAARVRLAELRLVALERRVEAELAAGLHADLIGELEALTIEHPYRERFVGQLMLALYRSGRQADALRVLRRAGRRLDEDLGVEPAAELRDLEFRILNQDRGLDLRPAPAGGDRWAAQAAEPRRPGPIWSVRGYELREQVGGGDQTVVYRAYQASVGREVALKVIRPERANAPGFVQSFELAAQSVARLEHPHIAALHDYWREPDGAYLVMRWLGGGSMAAALGDGTWSTPATLRVLGQLAGALSYAHRHGVVHGAVTPDNVLLDDEGNAYLGHFPIAAGAIAWSYAARSPVTTSPLDLEADRSVSADPDIAGLAALAHELLTGVRPSPDTVVTDERIAAEVRAVLTAGLTADPQIRPRRVDDFVRALRQAAGVDSVIVSDAAPLPYTDIRNPYKGLQAFQRTDAADFHGRDALVERIVRATRTHRLIGVVGPSGSGKSSVVRAGLLPRLIDDPDGAPLLVTEMFPGAFPFEELERALLRVAVDRPKGMLGDLSSDDRGLLRVVKQIVPDEHHEVVLVVDQFEELFSLVTDTATQHQFLDALVTAVSDPRSQLRVVATLRADFFDRPLEHAPFGELLERGLVPVTVPTREELARSVSQPAALVGLDLEPGLTGEIVDDVIGQPGGLPLLQYALTELFRTRRSNSLTREDYRRIGGVTGALGARAEQLYDDLDAAAQDAVRQVFLRLVTVDESADDIRRRVRLGDLSSLTAGAAVMDAPTAGRTAVGHAAMAGDARSTAADSDDADDRPGGIERSALDSVLGRYGSHRLLSFDRDPITRGPTVEVAHEALLREWTRLRHWIDTRRADLILYRRFAAAVDEWERSGRDASYLPQGGRLEQFEAGIADSQLTPTRSEREFLDASRGRRASEQRAVEERAQRQARTNRRLRRLLAGVGALSLLAAIAGLAAFTQARRAEDAAVVADARRVGALALAADDIDRALLLAVEGVHLNDSADTRANLLTTLGRSPELAGVLRGDLDRRFGIVSISADGRTGAVHDDASRIHFFDTDTLAITATYEAEHPHGTVIFNTGRATFHPHGGPVAVSVSTLEARPVRLLHPSTFTVLPDTLGGFPGPHLLPWGMAYSPDGTRLAVAFDRVPSRRRLLVNDSVVAVWDLAAPDEPVAVLTDVPRYTHDVAFGPEGRLLYSATHAAPPLYEAEPAITVHDLETGSVVRTLQVPSYPFALSPDGTRIAAASAAPERGGSNAGTDVLVMDAETGDQVQRLRGHTGPVTDVAYARDGSLLASASSDRTVAVWDVDTGDRAELLVGHAAAVAGAAFGPDGTAVLSAGVDGAVALWDRAGDRRFVSVRSSEGDLLARSGIELDDSTLVSPEGDAVLSIVQASDDNGFARVFVQVVDAGSGHAGPVVETGHSGIAEAAWHPGGRRFATTGADSIVRVWDAATTTVILEREVAGNGWTGVAYADGGAQVVVAGLYGTVQRLDGETLEPRSEPVNYYTGWLASVFAGADTDVFAIVTSASGIDLTGNEDQPEDRLLLIDVVDGETRQDLELGFDGEHADLSPDGARVAVTGDSGQIGLVDVAAGALVRSPVAAHEGAVESVDYAPDGTLIASGGSDGRVALWDGRSGDLLGSVRVTSAGTPAYVGFASDGHTLTIATKDGRIRSLDVRPEQWIDHACAVAGRNLTEREWRDAFGDRPYRETCGPR